ncbi:GAF domain-containing protein [Bradyrhizobium sp. JYMT SZCCT0428]|uniref:GAF domain-containing protein n=1 Tax=Bradyrhizobium sp. JYMT SZCCT0428 TaxID=2807673 RepID=UPI001BAABB57|nr:GAF domain-containing protein [Bradyrhizobium sp. JYMT SZCCT0428]MBR1156244.1 GAF domain-containing protein [Bradyrhizobium sp. JYMT SZCCT0428]
MARPSRPGGKTGRNTNPAKGRKTTKTKPRIAPVATRVKRRSISEDLKEAREQQAATAEILKVIASSPDDVQQVFDAIAHSAKRLIGGFSTAVHRIIEDIDHLVAFTPTNPESDAALKAAFPRHLSKVPAIALGVRNGKTAQVSDSETADARIRELGRARGWRSATYTPLMDRGTFIGFIVSTRRETGMLADHHVQLLRTFADQAVIAIKNVGLFNEVQARTDDLSEALRQQTATGDVLKVIASSPTDVGPALQAIVESACELCEADDAHVSLRDGNDLVFLAHHGSIPVSWQRQAIDREGMAGVAVIDRVPVHVHDLHGPEGDQFPRSQEYAHRSNVHTVLCIPLLREGDSIGVIVLRRTELRPFSEKQIALLQTFADQAVIAIGNVRLFEQVQAKTHDLTEALEQQTATAEVLQVISSSAGDLEPVFNKLLENATRICGANFGTMTVYEDGGFRSVALYNAPKAYADTQLYKVIRPHPESGLRAIEKTHRPVHIADLRAEPPYVAGNANVRALADLAGARTLLMVPMLKDQKLVGSITIFRQEVRHFTDKQTALVTNFASQAVIAIENARLLNELRHRTEELSRSLDELRTAQDRLVQTEKLASLGQLTAGIAHEIKNPLNFVNNFSTLSAELTDELNDILKSAALGEKMREEVDELTGLLKDNLEKVVQHGKRADSIVKNMLLHSREGASEHRPADINSLLDESLNLAYHGARAERSGFNIALKREFDPAAGTADIYPQEITRVLLNLISNGFYAATKRAVEPGDAYEPMLTVATKNRGDKVEIRIRDNGMGIAPEIKEKIFNPFFTTKPSGAGTGLGLSISHDIVVKQHRGTIDVDTEPGYFTEFIIMLPRIISAR